MLNSLRHVTAVLGLLSIAACAPLGPDFQEPEQAWLQDWQPQLYGESPASSATGPVTLDAWWAQFSDPTLSELMRVARSENPSLRITGLRILESRALAGIATGLSYPQVQTVSGNTAWVNQHRAGGDTRDLSSGELAFNLGWELDFWGRFRRGIESADAAYFASIAAQRDAQVLLTAQLATLYFNYKTTLQRIETWPCRNAATKFPSGDLNGGRIPSSTCNRQSRSIFLPWQPFPACSSPSPRPATHWARCWVARPAMCLSSLR